MKSIAIVGASNNRAKFGNQAVRDYAARGFQVYPINPTEREIEELPCFADIGSLPARPDIVSLYLPPVKVLELLPAIAAKGCDLLFLNPGTESPEVIARAAQLGLNARRECSLVALRSGSVRAE